MDFKGNTVRVLWQREQQDHVRACSKLAWQRVVVHAATGVHCYVTGLCEVIAMETHSETPLGTLRALSHVCSALRLRGKCSWLGSAYMLVVVQDHMVSCDAAGCHRAVLQLAASLCLQLPLAALLQAFGAPGA